MESLSDCWFNGVLRLSVNGTEVSGGEECDYRKGYLALESEGAPVEFRNIRIQELPSTGAAPEVTAPPDQGWRALFTGLDLRGWRTNATSAAVWHVAGERLREKSVPEQKSSQAALVTEAEFGNAEFVVDYRAAKPAAAADSKSSASPALQLRVSEHDSFVAELPEPEPGQYQRYQITVMGREVTIRKGDKVMSRPRMPEGVPGRGRFGLVPTGPGVEWMNLYVREL